MPLIIIGTPPLALAKLKTQIKCQYLILKLHRYYRKKHVNARKHKAKQSCLVKIPQRKRKNTMLVSLSSRVQLPPKPNLKQLVFGG